jgi:hypothetical protein
MRKLLSCLLILCCSVPVSATPTPPGTLITLTASATCNGVTTTSVCYLVVVKSHKFRYAPSAASITTYAGTMVSYVLGGVRLNGILLRDGRVFDGVVPVTPERW